MNRQGRLQRNQNDCTPKSVPSSRRDHQGAATLHETRKGTPILVSLYGWEDGVERDVALQCGNHVTSTEAVVSLWAPVL
jgi:hypothetical protein